MIEVLIPEHLVYLIIESTDNNARICFPNKKFIEYMSDEGFVLTFNKHVVRQPDLTQVVTVMFDNTLNAIAFKLKYLC